MGLIILSALLSLLFSTILWMAAGNLLPFRKKKKWPAIFNLAGYALIFLILIYSTIFFVS
jgi:hypothetical protein